MDLRRGHNAAEHRYDHSLKGLYRKNKYDAKRRKLAFKITIEEFAEFWQKPCYYCGYAIKTIGLDRIDSNRGYETDNLRACCLYCNRAKSDMTTVQFVALCSNVVRRHGLTYGRA